MPELLKAIKRMIDKEFGEIANGQSLFSKTVDSEIGVKIHGYKIDDVGYINLVKDQIAPILNARLKNLSGADQRKVLRLAGDKLIAEAILTITDIDNDTALPGETLEEVLLSISGIKTISTRSELISEINSTEEYSVIYNKTPGLVLDSDVAPVTSKTIIGREIIFSGTDFTTELITSGLFLDFYCPTKFVDISPAPSLSINTLAGTIRTITIRVMNAYGDGLISINNANHAFFIYTSIQGIEFQNVVNNASQSNWDKNSDATLPVTNGAEEIRQNKLGLFSRLQSSLSGFFYDAIGHGFRTEILLGSTVEESFSALPDTISVAGCIGATHDGHVVGVGSTASAGSGHSSVKSPTGSVSQNDITVDADFPTSIISSSDGKELFYSDTNLGGGGAGSQILKSVDSGSTWSVSHTQGSLPTIAGATRFSDGTLCFTEWNNATSGAKPKTLYSIDKGDNWLDGIEIANSDSGQNITLGILHNTFMKHSDGTIFFAVIGDLTEFWSILRSAPSIDGTFTEVGPILSGVDNETVNCSYMDGSNDTMYVGIKNLAANTMSISRSSDKGATWNVVYSVATTTTAESILKILKTPEGIFYASVRGSGSSNNKIIRSLDGGENWTIIVSNSTVIRDIVYVPYDTSIYIIKDNSADSKGFLIETIAVEKEYATGDGTPVKQRFYNGVVDFFGGGVVSIGEKINWGLSRLSIAKTYIGILRNSDAPIAPSKAPLGSFFRNTLDSNRLCEKGLDGSIGRVGYTTLLNIEIFGANPNATAEINRVAIQSAIDFSESSMVYSGVFIPPKTYEIDEYLTIGSDSKLVGTNGSTIKAGNLVMDLFITNKNENSIGVYGGNKNITIENIIFDANRTTTGQDITILGFAHCDNVQVINCEFTKWSEWHAIEFNACSNSGSYGCRYHDAIQSDLNEEAIQLDVSNNFGAFPWPSGAPYDSTPCKNITIDNCTFENVSTGIGCHNHSENIVVDGVTIRDCLFNTLKYRCVSSYNWKNLLVTGCTVYDAERFVNCFGLGLTIPGLVSGIKVVNNSIELVQYGLNVDQDSGVNVDGVTDGVIFSNNILKNITKVANNSRAMWIQGESQSKIHNVIAMGNTVDVTNQYGITADYCVNPIFSGNKVTGCEQSGIVMFSCTGGIISANIAKGNNTDAGSYYDINYYGSGSNGLLTGNNCETLNVQDVTNTHVEGNKITTAFTIAGATNTSIYVDPKGNIAYNGATIPSDLETVDTVSVVAENTITRYRTTTETLFINCKYNGTNYIAINAGSCAVHLKTGSVINYRKYAGATAGQDLGTSINGAGWSIITPS